MNEELYRPAGEAKKVTNEELVKAIESFYTSLWLRDGGFDLTEVLQEVRGVFGRVKQSGKGVL